MIGSALMFMAMAHFLYIISIMAFNCIGHVICSGFDAAWKALMAARQGKYCKLFARSCQLGAIYAFVGVRVAGTALASFWPGAPTDTWVTLSAISTYVCLRAKAAVAEKTQRIVGFVNSVSGHAIAIKQELSCWASYFAWTALAWITTALAWYIMGELAFTRYKCGHIAMAVCHWPCSTN
jgi:hypothetical protein